MGRVPSYRARRYAIAQVQRWACILEHSNSRFESIRFDSLCESILIDSFSKKNQPFDSLVVMQFFLVYLLYSLSQKNKLTSLFAAFNTLDVFN